MKRARALHWNTLRMPDFLHRPRPELRRSVRCSWTDGDRVPTSVGALRSRRFDVAHQVSGVVDLYRSAREPSRVGLPW
eukprot:7069283-Prymnesium_polylepis.1